MNQKAQSLLRQFRLLQLADQIRFVFHVARSWPANRRFRNEHPEFAVPPALLAFDAYTAVNFPYYRACGESSAKFIADLLQQFCSAKQKQILDWGCGPAAIVRHLPSLLPADTTIFATDANEKSINWCRAHIQGVKFCTNAMDPPLPFKNEQFDAISGISVLTHLSEKSAQAWVQELRRLLKKNGILILTLKGDSYQRLLLPDEQAEYAGKGVVVRGKVKEGKKMYVAFHNPSFVRNQLLRDFDVLLHSPDIPYIQQDVWVARKPSTSE